MHPDEPADAPLAAVRYATGYHDDPVRLYVPSPFFANEERWDTIPELTREGWIEVNPLTPGVVATLYVRNVARRDQGFQQVKGFTGEIHGAIANEILFLDTPGPLPGPIRLPIGNLFKVYNGFSMRDGDLLLLELSQPSTGRIQRSVFQYRAFGLRSRVSYAVLFRVPVPGLQDAETIDVGGLSFTVSLSLGYSFRAETAAARFVSDRLAAVALVGVGSTYQVDTTRPIDDQVRGAFTSGIIGAGIEVFDFLSLNFLFNPSSLTGNEAQSVWAAAVGFDAVKFATFTQDIIPRLFGDNELEPMKADPWWQGPQGQAEGDEGSQGDEGEP